MHEMSLCESIVRIVEYHLEKEADEGHSYRALMVRIELGEYSCASEESLRFCFPHAAKGTRAENAALEFIRTPGDELRVVEVEVG